MVLWIVAPNLSKPVNSEEESGVTFLWVAYKMLFLRLDLRPH